MNSEKAIDVIHEIEQEMSDEGKLTNKKMAALDLAVNCLKDMSDKSEEKESESDKEESDSLTEINLRVMAAVQPDNLLQWLLLAGRKQFVYADYIDVPMFEASLDKFDVPSFRVRGSWQSPNDKVEYVLCTVRNRDLMQFLLAMKDYEDRVSKFDNVLIEKMNIFLD